jgi:hypothetical protein
MLPQAGNQFWKFSFELFLGQFACGRFIGRLARGEGQRGVARHPSGHGDSDDFFQYEAWPVGGIVFHHASDRGQLLFVTVPLRQVRQAW